MQRSDAAELERMFHDPRVYRFLPYERRLETGLEYVGVSARGRARGQRYRFVARLRGSGELVAVVSLFGIAPYDRSGEVGYALPFDRWGRGYATEAVSVVLARAFDTLGLHRVGANVAAPNRASTRVLRKLGFHREGRAREASAGARGYHDLVLFGLLAEEFHRGVRRRSRIGAPADGE